MKAKLFLAAVLAACVCLSACSGQGETGSAGSTASSSAEAPSSSGSSEASETSGSSEATKTATFSIAGNNAQGTTVTIDVPAQWEADGDKLISDGQIIARFEIILGIDTGGEGEAFSYLENMRTWAAGENGSGAVIEDLDIPGIEGVRCSAQIENVPGEVVDGSRYYIGMDERAVCIAFTPISGIDPEPQRADFEQCLASLKIGG